MQIEPWVIAASIGGLGIAIGALAARDHETPMRVLLRENLGFVLGGALVPFLLFGFVTPALPEPWRGVAIGGVVFAAATLAAAYLRRRPAEVRGALIGAVAYAVGLTIAALLPD